MKSVKKYTKLALIQFKLSSQAFVCFFERPSSSTVQISSMYRSLIVNSFKGVLLHLRADDSGLRLIEENWRKTLCCGTSCLFFPHLTDHCITWPSSRWRFLKHGSL